MGYARVPMASLWPNGGNKANWRNIWAKKIFFFKKILYVIPSALLSFLPYYCHSFWIIVIASVLVSFLLNTVVPSEVLSFQIFVILDSSSTLTYLKGEKIGCQSWPYLWVNANIFTFLRFTIRKETKLPFLLILAGTENSIFFPHQNINILFHKDTFNL